jgi:AraC family transcriptional regulator
MNEDYIKRVNKILGYIDNNLSDDLSLETIAKIAFYSPFHLHRLFKSITNETLNCYVTRKRIEKAASVLMHKKEVSISDLVLQLGFSSNSSFTRAFKKYYKQSPSDFRKSHRNSFSKISQTNSKKGKESKEPEEYLCTQDNLKQRMQMMNTRIEIKELPAMNWAFITQIGPDGLDAAFGRLLQWAIPKGLVGDDLKMGRIFHDSFKITEPEKVRMSACLLLQKPVEVSGEIGHTTTPKGNYIVGHFTIEPMEFGASWKALFNWMNENGYKKADQNPFEIISNNYNEHPEKKCIVDLCIPIE